MRSAYQRTWNVQLSTGIVGVAILGLAPLFGWALAAEQWIIFGALVIVALVPIFIRWPVVSTFGLYALLATSFDSLPLLAGAGTLTKPAGMLAGAVLLAAGLMEGRLVRPPLAALWWGLFILWGVFSATWALKPELVFGRLQMALSLFLLYLVSVSIRPSRREFYWVCVLTACGGAMAAAVGYLFGLGEDATGAVDRGRVALGGYDSNPNTLGSSLVLPLALALAGFVLLRGVVQRAMAVACVGLMGVGIYISMSRAALLAMITMISVFAHRIGVRRQIVFALVILSLLGAAMPDKFYERISAVATGEDATGAGRTEIWKVGLEALQSFGIFGAGLDNFHEAYSEYVTSRQPAKAAHNLYLMVWVELGIFGLVLMLAASGSQLLAVRRVRKAGHGGVALAALEAACIGVLVLNFFGDQIWRKFFWLAWTLLAWATYCEKQSDEAVDAPGLSGR